MYGEIVKSITFLLAMLGYGGLTVTLIFSRKGKIPFTFWRVVSLIILLHVFMIWTIHYEWNFSTAVRNGYSGFLIFHSSLLMILISTFVYKSIALILIRISSVVVTVGAVGAVFRYESVQSYKLPVIICALAIGVTLLVILNEKRKSMKR